MKTETIPTLDAQLASLVPIWRRLLIELKGQIGDDYRASDDSEDNLPGMGVTIGFTPANHKEDGADCSWSYQTGDNSYTGGAYGHPHWAVISLYRKSNCTELANEIADQIGFRAERNKALADANRFDLPTWDSLKVYGEPEPPTCPTCNVSARSIRLAGNARRCQNCGSEWNQ